MSMLFITAKSYFFLTNYSYSFRYVNINNGRDILKNLM